MTYQGWRDFGFSHRTAACLANGGYDSLYKLMQTTEAQILRLPNAGRLTLLEIVERIPLRDTTPYRTELLRERVRRSQAYNAEYKTHGAYYRR